MLYQSWADRELCELDDLVDWVQVNSEKLECARDKATSSQIEVSAKRAGKWNQKAVDRSFQIGDLVWIRRPGLDQKLRESGEGPGKVLARNSPNSYRIETDKRVIPTVHIQQLKAYVRPKVVKRVTSVLQDETENDDILHRYAEATVEPQQLTEAQQRQLAELLERHIQILTKDPGLTTMATFDIDTGQADSVYQRPYNTPIVLRQSIDVEIDWLLSKAYIRPSSSPWASISHGHCAEG